MVLDTTKDQGKSADFALYTEVNLLIFLRIKNIDHHG